VIDENCMSYWFPKIEQAGLPVPPTVLIMGEDLTPLIDGPQCPPRILNAAQAMVHRIREIAVTQEIGGWPIFLRTGHLSGKHDWANCCYVPSDAIVLERHIASLVEAAAMADLPANVWAVRKLLTTRTFGVCHRWGGMPVSKEFRFFASSESGVACWHPYWPIGALVQGGLGHARIDAYQQLCDLDHDDLLKLSLLADRAVQAVGGAWSVDFMQTTDDWVLIDMARAQDSWHWPGCAMDPRAADRRPQQP